VSGTGVLPAALTVVAHGGSSANFGAAQYSVDTAAGQFDVSNQANGQLTLPTASLTNTTDFKITGGTCLTTAGIANGGSCTVLVVYDPQSVSATALASTLNITSSTGVGSTSLVLQGTSTSALTVDKPNDTAITNPTDHEDFTFTNATGANDTGQLAVALSGTDKDTFQITNDTCTMKGHLPGVGNGAARGCVVTIAFLPAAGVSTGAKTATLTVSGVVAGNAATVGLTATK
jgi:hypothetical protein